MATKAAAAAGKMSKEQAQLRKLRNRTVGQRHWAAWKLTGNYNSATAFGAFSTAGYVDIIDKAAKNPRAMDSAYNNFLTQDGKPAFTVYGRSIGIYLGEALANSTYPIKAVLAEHAYLDLKLASGASLVKQPLITMAAGFGVEQRYSTADTAGADKRVNETFGPLTPMGLLPLPDNTGQGTWAFPETEQIRANLTIEPNALTDILAALAAGSIPTRGAIIALCIFGDSALKVTATR